MKKLCYQLISVFLLLLGGITLANASWVAVGGINNPVIITSADGSNWTRVPLSQNGLFLLGVAHDDSGNWVAVGGDVINYKTAILYSSGSTNNWVAITPPSDDNITLFNVAWANNMWVAVGQKDYPDGPGIIMTSSNGTTWSIQSLNVPEEVSLGSLTSLAYANGKWVVVGDSAYSPSTGGTFESGAIGTSIDGVTWTFQLPSFRNLWPTFYSTAYGGNGSSTGKWVAVGQNASTQAISTSVDGLSWGITRLQPNCILWNVAYGNDQWMVLGRGTTQQPANSCVLVSQNATTWVPVAKQLNGDFVSIAYGDNTWVAVGNENYVAISKNNGTVWTYAQIPASGTISLHSIAYAK